MAHAIPFNASEPGLLDQLPDAAVNQAVTDSLVSDIDGKRTLSKPVLDDLEKLSAALQDSGWHDHCRTQVKTINPIPSGATYLAQLMAHDTSFTLARTDLFESDAAGSPPMNTLGSPLVLSTLYGRGRHGDAQVFNGGSFRLGQNGLPCFLVRADEGPKYDPISSMPLLADQRNGDSPMLLGITTAFMQFHNAMMNRVGDWLRKSPALDMEHSKRFIFARAQVIRSWHQIIRSDVLDTTCRTASVCDHTARLTNGTDDLHELAMMSHAALRCFHALVLKNYRFRMSGGMRESVKITLKDVAKGHNLNPKNGKTVREWAKRWQPEWPLFFDASVEDANTTLFSPSFVFSNANKVDIAHRDFIAGIDHGAPGAKALNIPPERMERLYRALDIRFGTGHNWASWGKKMPTPAMLGLLAEGYYMSEIDDYGVPVEPVDCRLGPVASALVRCGMEKLLDAAETKVCHSLHHAGITDVAPPFDLPRNFMEMVQFTKGE